MPAPSAPSALTATAGDGVIALAWAAAAGADTYNIYRGTSSGGESSTPLATLVLGLSFSDGEVVNGTTYYYKIKAVNGSGTSSYSNEASATPAAGSLGTPVTYTGTEGPGMTATVTDCGSRGGGLMLAENVGEFSDERLIKVMGPKKWYDAQLAMIAAGAGWNATHPYIPGINCFDVKPKTKVQGNGNVGWMMTAGYKRPPTGSFQSPDPTSRPAVIGINFSFYQVPAEVDADGNVIVNSAGDIFDPPQMIDAVLIRIRLKMWRTSYPFSTAKGIIGKVNDSAETFTILGSLGARVVKLLNWAPANDIELTASIVPTVFDLEVNELLYDRKIIDKGLQAWYRDNTDATSRKGRLSSRTSMQEVAAPVLLDGTGTPLLPTNYSIYNMAKGFHSFQTQSGGSKKYPSYVTATQGASGQEAWYLPYRVEREADFSPVIAAGV